MPPLWAIARSKSPSAGGARQQGDHVESARGFAEDRDVVGISAKGGDVLPHPLEPTDQIEGSEVPRCVQRVGVGGQGGVAKPAEDAQAIVEGDEDDVVLVDQRAPVVDVALAEQIGTAVDPDHDGQALAVSGHLRGREGGRVEVQVETVLAAHVESVGVSAV